MKKLLIALLMLLPVTLWAQTTAEPYAVLSQDSLTVTFYYDDQKASRGGMEINSRYINSFNGEKNPYGTAVTAIFDESFANYTTLTSTAYWFFECNNLTEIRGLSNLNTANVTNMGYMFVACSGLTSLDVSNFNTANVTDMAGMFNQCSGLTSLDLSGFNTANVTSMIGMFYGCSSLTSLDVSGFNTANVTNMGGMFQNCSSLTSLDVSGFNTANVTNMGSMFSGCSGLTSLDVSGFNTANVTSMSWMFNGCSALTSLNLSGFNTSNVTDMGWMFSDCSGLTSLDLSSFNTANVMNMGSMFSSCSGLTSLDLSGFNTANVTIMWHMFSSCSGLTSLDLSGFKTDNVTDMRYMFNGCSGLTNLDLSGFNTANVTDMNAMFQGCSGLTSLDLSGFNTVNVMDMSQMFQVCSGLTSLDLSGFNTANVTDMGYMFSHCSSLTSLDLSSFNTANVTDMRFMFYNCSSLTSLDVSGFNTANVTSMSCMFSYCSCLTSLDLSSFHPSKVTSMSEMFYECSCLTSLDLSGFNTAKVTSMSEMFYGCSSLTSLDLSSFNTANVTNMWYMFYGCSCLTSLDLSGFNTSKVTDMGCMFYGCSSLTSLDLSSFKTDNVGNMQLMFCGCSNLKTIYYVGKPWSTWSDSMFAMCFRLVGGAGTSYYVKHPNYKYARIDGGAEDPGYFTRSGDEPFVFPDTVSAPVITQDGNVVTMTTETEKATICYTLSNSQVGEQFYTAPLTMTSSCIIKAWAIRGGYHDSDTTRYEFIYTSVGEATFDGLVATVSGDKTLDDAFEEVGGRSEAAKTIAAVVWNKETALTEEMLQGLDNPNLLIYVNDASLAPANHNNVVVNGETKSIVLTDTKEGNGNFYVPQAFTAETISYTRDFLQQTQVGVSRGWESIALPFDVQSVKHEKQGDIAPFGSTESGKHFWLRRLTPDGLQRATRIEANVPYVLSMPNNEEYSAEYNLGGRVTFSAQNATVPVTAAKVTALADSSITMVPTTVAVGRSSSVWALNVGQVRGSYLEGSVFERDYREVRPFEAYTVHRQGSSDDDNPSPRMIPVQKLMGSDATGIEEVRVERSEVSGDRWYDLNGRRLQARPTAKGVYIKDGRKVVIK